VGIVSAVAVAVQRVMHVNMNCRDLDRSLAFYRELLELQTFVHTAAFPQPGDAFGIEGDVRWDAQILQDARGFDGPSLDLLEWKEPPPTGSPYAEPNHLGMFRLCTLVPDLDAVFARAEALGAQCVSPPTELPLGSESAPTVRVFLCADPDGQMLEFVEQPGAARLMHVNVNCSDVARSCEWYERVLGLDVRGSSNPGPVPGAAFGVEGDVEWDARRLFVAGRDDFAIDLLEWKKPAPFGRPYAEANHLGLYRLAFLVEDVHESFEELERLAIECAPPARLDMGPTIPIDGVWALFFSDPDGVCLELIENPKL
jgi:catechol 2,3-dioxygenase-like lactoylglutathione lyase family enzyme